MCAMFCSKYIQYLSNESEYGKYRTWNKQATSLIQNLKLCKHNFDLYYYSTQETISLRKKNKDIDK